MLLLLRSCVHTRGRPSSAQHVLHLVRAIRLGVVLGRGVTPGEVSARALGLEPDRLGGPLARGFPAGGERRGCCEACAYCAERGALDLVGS